ncbi:hypothetical protein DPMN_137464 [Dreissena polymorpha]|uniref:Uncharacterized protein n=1 Tax=Dreissena polymorpha TaxID=45954 RepID=A0A9D4G2M0_DREPO|nr:hypothetical protein DPMN_137464 [Dreissena polymorpha]
MDDESQSQLKAVRPKTIISTRTTTTIGASNGLTMYETVETAHAATEMRKCNLSILGNIKDVKDWLWAEATDV